MRTVATVTALLFAFAACGREEHDHEHDGEEEAHEHEEHAAEHGGDLVEFGNHEGHLEVKIDHDTGTMTVWVYDGEMKALALDSAPVLNFTAGGAPKQIEGKGKGSEWTFTDDALKGEPENVRFKLVAGGRPYTPSWEHAHD